MSRDRFAATLGAGGRALLAGTILAGVALADGPPRRAPRSPHARPIGITMTPASSPAPTPTPSRALSFIDPAVRTAGREDDPPPAGATPMPPDPIEAEPPKPRVAPPVAAARYEGMAAPGVQVVLRGDGSTGADLRYLWVQTGGPPVPLGEADGPSVRLTVPDGAASLEFLLVVSNEAGVDKVRLNIPIEGRSTASAVPGMKADAGDDQVGVVGRQITLNGGRSEPRGKVGFRWLQIAGPAVRLKIEDGHVFSFVPDRPGAYRFVLLVASGGVISEPDEVEVVTIATAPTTRVAAPSRPEAAPTATFVAPPRPREPEPLLDQFVRSSLAGLEGGPAVADDLADAFEGAAGRLDLYRSYNEAFSELSRRLDPLVPGDPARRAAWVERLFAPATARLIEELRKEGLDLSGVAGREAAMTDAQRRRMADVFRAIGEGARAAGPGAVGGR